jgi:hypothetical protein
LEWQREKVFGHRFDFNQWKVLAVTEEDQPYTAYCNISTTERHYALLKATSIRFLEAYLVKTNVAGDRLRNAKILLDNIKALAVNADSFSIFHRMLNESKKNALQDDAREDVSRFSFFRRHRFGSRYIALLDDLKERVLFCQPQKGRESFKQCELADYDELKKQLAARVDDDHATRYLAEQVERKEKFLKRSFV